MLHVANGDEALSTLRAAGLPGEVVAWSDVLDQGPVRGDPGTARFRDLRARWLEEDGSFPRVRAREAVPWITDLFFAGVVTELHDAGMFDEPARSECLAGRLDYRTRAPDRWVGGVLLQGSSCVRRDGLRIVSP